jgi:hypothetical protein
MNFKAWLEETAGEDHSRLNSECPGFGRSRFGTDAYPKPKDPTYLKDKKEPLLGFMKSKMKKK